MKKRGIIYLLLIFILFIFVFIILFDDKDDEGCFSEKDCIPSSCCHAEKCVNINNSENCSNIYCTQECSGPLDCGAGSCGCVKNKCEVIKNE